MNYFISLRKLLLVILALMAALFLFGLALGSGIAEGLTKTSFIVYIFISTLLIIEFVLLLKKKWVKPVSIFLLRRFFICLGNTLKYFIYRRGLLLTSLKLRVEQVVKALKRIGISSSEPKVLADGGNLIVHLFPYPIVARVMTLFEEDDPLYCRNILAREIDVACYLDRAGVPVVKPIHDFDPGPHPIGDTWCTLWEYIPNVNLPPLNGDEAFNLLKNLESGMKTYPGYLPRLGAWTPVCDAMSQLSTIENEQIRDLTEYWTKIDKRLRGISADKLVPAHGDAHLGNLIASPKGWLWIDFEDVSLMPRFWDLASAVARTPLLGEAKGLSDTLIRNYLGETPNQDDTEAFILALSARLIASISFNIRLALEGHSNSELAWRRLNNGLHILDRIFCGKV
jgi:hypothetical protein